jgi:hypothetical protein
MLRYIALAIVLIIAMYTILFGIEEWKQKNYSGSFAIIFLACVVVALPFYILLLKKG